MGTTRGRLLGEILVKKIGSWEITSFSEGIQGGKMRQVWFRLFNVAQDLHNGISVSV